ncbi:tyrosine-type recombinase/integrase [Edwardsiella tarda]|uniref:phage integrase n=1 Tax=Edwardsiella tarda TaxID=636 RepID=UPI002443808D|nr:tyrosine-type recombinase/integrase [Edwardsiella tarda]WGE29442.1 tyrosine-type recombinase/integrase [Edwardsiella tarda]
MSVKSQDGHYLVDVRPSGRGGKRIRKKFSTKAEALQYERWLLATQHKKDWLDKPADRRPLLELIELWWRHHGQLMKAGNNIKQKLLRLDVVMGHPCANQVTASSLSECRILRIEQGIKPSTVNREIGALRAMFSSLISSGHYHNANPLSGLSEMKVHSHEMGYLSRDECLALLAELDGAEKLAVEIALSTGARWGEVAKLEQMQVRNGRITFINTKNSKNRTVPISDDLQKAIKERKGVVIFPSLDYTSIRDAIKRIAPGIPKGQAVHALRHTFASHFMMNGGNILTLQKILGHSKIQMTMVYAHLAPDYLQDAVRFNPLA